MATGFCDRLLVTLFIVVLFAKFVSASITVHLEGKYATHGRK